jgi:outer membrane receptor protein involved in Fe transport
MRPFQKTLLVSLGSAAFIAGAHAQPVTQPNNGVGAPLASPGAPAVAGNATTPTAAAGLRTSGRGRIEEVVVTAQRRKERLRDVPLTVTAISASALAQAGVTTVTDLGAVVPGVQVGNAVGFATPHIRGVGSTAIGPGIETDVAIYVDGVYYASTSGSLFDFVGVSNIEVLKGPQGTLFGRNATGGLINVITKDPTQQTHVDADLTYGNYQTGKADLYLSGGITPDLVANLAIQGGTMGEGYGKNFTTGKSIGRDIFNGEARSKWIYTPSDETKLTLSLDYINQRNTFAEQRIPIGDVHLPSLKTPEPYGSAWDEQDNEMPLFASKGGGAALKFDQDLGFAHLMDIVAYRQSTTTIDFDLDYTPLAEEGAFLHTDENSFSNELQLSSTSSGPIRWTTGLFYFKSDSRYDPTHVTFDPLLAGTPFNALSVDSDQRVYSLAAYAQATAKITENTNVTGGIRYSYEHHDFLGTTYFYGPDNMPSTIVPTSVAPEERASFDKPTYRLALDHHFSKDLMAYASYTTGFKSGGFNSQTPGTPAFLPEKLIAYEVGTKDVFLDNRLRINLSGFYYNYTDIQVQEVSLATTGITNGAAARLKGADVDFNAVVTPNFTLNGSAEYLDTDFLSFPDSPQGPPLGTPPEGVDGPGNASGHSLPYSPRWVFTVSGNYTLQLADEQELNLNVLVNHSGGYFLEADNVLRQHPFTKLTAELKWSFQNGKYDVSLWGHNITNVPTLAYESTLGDGQRNATYNPPHTYGITLSYHM